MVAPKRGKYQLCWNVSGTTGCSGSFAGGDRPVFLKRVGFTTQRPLLFGSSLTGDGRPCWVHDGFFDLDVSTTVTASGRTVRANTKGVYAFVAMTPGIHVVEARCEKSRSTAKVRLASIPLRRNLNFTNRAPQLAELSAGSGTASLKSVAPGDAVMLSSTARDPDGDAVEYLWRTVKSTAEIENTRTRTAKFTMATVPGTNAAYVLAVDGKGGFNYKRIELLGQVPDLSFSGTVIDEVSRAPIPGARVSVAGRSATSNARGWFAIKAPPQAGDRYVLNIDHPNFAATARIYDRGSPGGVYELIRAQVRSFAPGAEIDVTDTRSSGPCGGGETATTGKGS
ncbi:MAG: carboxypeptidase regulatory-like domain-containing protein, partial [Burkholderiales bacterium]